MSVAAGNLGAIRPHLKLAVGPLLLVGYKLGAADHVGQPGWRMSMLNALRTLKRGVKKLLREAGLPLMWVKRNPGSWLCAELNFDVAQPSAIENPTQLCVASAVACQDVAPEA